MGIVVSRSAVSNSCESLEVRRRAAHRLRARPSGSKDAGEQKRKRNKRSSFLFFKPLFFLLRADLAQGAEERVGGCGGLCLLQRDGIGCSYVNAGSQRKRWNRFEVRSEVGRARKCGFSLDGNKPIRKDVLLSVRNDKVC
jgi:hypothetical protein